MYADTVCWCMVGIVELLFDSETTRNSPVETTPMHDGRPGSEVCLAVCCGSCEEHLVSDLKIKTPCCGVRLPLSLPLCLLSTVSTP